MTFADAVNMLSDGRAAKPANWGGYVYRTDSTDPESQVEYSIIFRPRGYNGTTVTEFTYDYGKDGEWSSPDWADLKAPLFAAMVADNWVVGRKEDFEEARSGTGEW